MAKKSALPNGTWKHSRRVAWRKVADEVVILDVETAVYYSLRGPGLRIWELIGQGRTVPEIARTLAGEYSADEGRILKDAIRLTGKLRQEGLIERA